MPIHTCLLLPGPGVEGTVDFLQVGTVQVSVNLCGGNIHMPQHFLNDTQISTSLQKMGGKGMPEGMGAHGFVQLSPGSQFFQNKPVLYPLKLLSIYHIYLNGEIVCKFPEK